MFYVNKITEINFFKRFKIVDRNFSKQNNVFFINIYL